MSAGGRWAEHLIGKERILPKDVWAKSCSLKNESAGAFLIGAFLTDFIQKSTTKWAALDLIQSSIGDQTLKLLNNLLPHSWQSEQIIFCMISILVSPEGVYFIIHKMKHNISHLHHMWNILCLLIVFQSLEPTAGEAVINGWTNTLHWSMGKFS